MTRRTAGRCERKMAKRKTKACGASRAKKERLKQSTLAQSSSGSGSEAGDAPRERDVENGGEQSVPGGSGAVPLCGGVQSAHVVAGALKPRSQSESSDSEPDPDSSSVCLQSESSRDSSPDPHVSTEDLRRRVPETSRGRSLRGRGAGRCPSLELDAVWCHGDWESTKFPFTAAPGPQNAAADLVSDQPVDFLELILTDELLGHIASETNLYAQKYVEAHPETPHARDWVWKPVTVPELKTYFGLSFLTGYIKKPSLSMYWSEDPLEATPFFNAAMPRNRYQLIRKFLHFNDNSKQDAEDKLYKVRPVLEFIISKFKELYQPFENICMDEGMMRWRGRLNFRVYNPQEPVKCGVKSYILCDSKTGYCFNMLPYVGQSSTLQDTVFSLLDRLTDQGYTLFMDNFYNSVTLCEQLVEKKTNVCGTLRRNRGEPQVIRGEARVVQYNICMNGVDKLDKNIAYYPVIRKTQNWTKKFVAYLFQICIFNAFVLYKARNPGKSKTHLEFMKCVVRSWSTKTVPKLEEGEEVEVPQERAARRRDPDNRLDGLMSRHKLENLRPTTKAHPSRKCRVCVRRGERSETRLWCTACSVPLHAGECYTAYHTQEKYY